MNNSSTKALPSGLHPVLSGNRWFFMPFLLFLMGSMILLSVYEQGYWVLYFGANRSPFWNTFFLIGTRLGEEWAFIGIFLLSLIFLRYRVAITIPILAGMTTLVSFLAKKGFQHPRPLRYFRDMGLEDQLNLIEDIHINSGPTSFPSGHTMAAFALFSFLALNSPTKKWTGPLCFLLALTVGVSRIYLSQHFLKDVFLGALLGTTLGLLFFYLQRYWGNKAWLDKRLLEG
jgi:membrane-associated phospholipid phosphatase